MVTTSAPNGQSTLFGNDPSYSGAIFDESETYRYLLWRRWAEGAPILWIMLNPSTADASTLDPTLRRCIDFSKQWGFPAMEIANIYAYRSTTPANIWKTEDPQGPSNLKHVELAIERAGKIMLGWGRHAKSPDVKLVCELIRAHGKTPYALLVNKDGSPQHPLYIPKTTVPQPWAPEA